MHDFGHFIRIKMSRYFFLLAVFTFVCSHAFCQKDSTSVDQNDSTSGGILNNKLTKELISTVTRRNNGPFSEKNVKSEDVFMIYEGKIIRNIIVRHINFERSIYDTTKNVATTFTRLAEKLHSDTRPNVIYNHLFFYSNKPLDPFRLADNERYLRDLDFILDSKISVYPVIGSPDSVDVEVVTRDVFSLGLRPRVSSFDKYSLAIYDANLFGRGQRVQADFLFEGGRSPVTGKGIHYTKSSVGGSLINLSVAYTELNAGPSLGEENEYSYYLNLNRPLVSPYTRLAGGLELSRNWSVNINNDPDSVFRRYRYFDQDAWVGYNIGIKKEARDRSRHFVALRYFQQNFDIQPMQEMERTRRIYNNARFLLGGITFYNQNFYKTNYVYGFGRTEDVPYGTSVNITTGWGEEVGIRRTYIGSTISKRIVTDIGRFYSFELGAGSYFNQRKAEDAVIYLNAVYFSKLYEIRKVKIRHQFRGGYGRAFNNRIQDLLKLDNQLQGFSPDSLFGFQRTLLQIETTIFTPGQILGFRLAPFVSIEGATLDRTDDFKKRRDFFWGLSSGFRIRNENLIFGTVEFRVTYFPKTVPGVDHIAFKITSNLRIKYSGAFVRPPTFISFN
jgi:hypothetical protein